jgi:hypothetical protein
VRPGLASKQFLQCPSDGAPLNPALAGIDLADAGDKETVRHLFQHHTVHSEAASLQGLVDIQGGRQEDDSHAAGRLSELLKHRPSVLAGQAEIEDQDIWAVLAHCLQGLLSSAAAGHDVAVVVAGE